MKSNNEPSSEHQHFVQPLHHLHPHRRPNHFHTNVSSCSSHAHARYEGVYAGYVDPRPFLIIFQFVTRLYNWTSSSSIALCCVSPAISFCDWCVGASHSSVRKCVRNKTSIHNASAKALCAIDVANCAGVVFVWGCECLREYIFGIEANCGGVAWLRCWGVDAHFATHTHATSWSWCAHKVLEIRIGTCAQRASCRCRCSLYRSDTFHNFRVSFRTARARAHVTFTRILYSKCVWLCARVQETQFTFCTRTEHTAQRHRRRCHRRCADVLRTAASPVPQNDESK